MEALTPFQPARGLTNPSTQSFLASFRGRNLRTRAVGGQRLEAATVDRIIDCGDGVRLHALISDQPGQSSGRALGRVVLIHGWEGCAYSVYLFSLANTLYKAGFDVVRLHLRDHGGTQQLNPGIFHAGRLVEASNAVALLGAERPELPLSLVGFSLGGNFALRMAAAQTSVVAPLNKVIAVCPVIDPQQSLNQLLLAPPFYQRYFRAKMMRAFLRKQQSFPSLYNFDWLSEGDDLATVLSYFAENMTPFQSLERYFDSYRVGEDELHASPSPVELIAATDDPVVPTARSIASWRGSERLRLEFAEFGGHCGFISDWWGRSWIDQRILQSLIAN